MILHTIGTKSGEVRKIPLVALRSDDRIRLGEPDRSAHSAERGDLDGLPFSGSGHP